MNDQRTRVLFVCIGNSCRSQMAEGFASRYGADVMVAASAGLSPAQGVAPDTKRAMQEKNIDVQHHFPKGFRQFSKSRFDLVVNMSGFDLPEGLGASIRKWEVRDPISLDFEQHCAIRDQIETLVMNLILELRRTVKSRNNAL